MMKAILPIVFAAAALAIPLSAQVQPDEVLVYKSVDAVDLTLHVFNPPGHAASDKRPAMVFFFGGGWVKGTPEQFYRQSATLAARGMVAICADYRTENRHGTTPRECVMDGKSAMRWVRIHADRMGIDPDRIAAGGGSAGGHVAAATALVAGFNEDGEDTEASSRPNALVLFNPVIDNGLDGYGYGRVKDYWESFSPLHNIAPGAPPTVILLGTEDELVPVATAEAFAERMLAVGSRCELVLYEGQPHGFFNKAKYEETLQDMDRFLVSLGFLEVALPADSGTPFKKGALIYERDLACPESVAGWRMEGPGKIEFKDGWMHMYSPGREMHHVYWCPETFPGSFIAEWEVRNSDPEWGLCIVFFSAKGVNGEDIFDPALPERDGTFSQYVQGSINSYHISYYANTPHEQGRERANLRKNNAFALLQSGHEGVPKKSDSIHRIRLIKDDGHILMYVDGRKIIDYLDDGTGYGPVYQEGKMGFRQMQWTHFAYRNLRVWELADQGAL